MQSIPAAASFDLTQQPWLLVQRMDGSEDELSLRDVFAHAHDVRRLVGDVPTQEFALLRLLLAILHDVVEGPEDILDWQQLWVNGLPVERITGYLDRHRERFDLLHPTQPFLQTAELRTAKGEVNGLDRIVADVPNGLPFFTMRGRGVDHLTFPEAARWLVHAHAFDTSGIKTGVLDDPRVRGGRAYPQGVAWAGNLGGVFVEGLNLRQTLLLNLIAFDTDSLCINQDFDRPAWRRPPSTPGEADALELSRRPAGVRDLYTWQSRRVRLFHDGQVVTGVILTYGDPLVPYNKYQHEPMTAWRRSPTQEKKLGLAQVYMPREHNVSRSAWRGLGALVTGHVAGAEERGEAAAIVRPRILDWISRINAESNVPPDYLIRVRLIGVRYGTQQSVIDEIIDDAVTMPVSVLHTRDQRFGQAAIDAVADAEAAVTVLGDLAGELARAGGGRPESQRGTARYEGFAKLDAAYRAWLVAMSPEDDAHERRADWQRQVYEIIGNLGNELLQAAGDNAWEGRVFETKRSESLWLNDSYADLRFRARLRFALSNGGEPIMAAPPQETTSTRRAVADLVGNVASSYISELQRGYQADRRASVVALAQLRRGAGKLPEEVPELLVVAGTQQLYSAQSLPEGEVLKAEFALFSAVTLYAMHQQFKPGQPMHRAGAGLGAAIRRLMPSNTLDEPIRHRFVRLGTASTPKALAERLREVVILLRNAGLPLDYEILARQLYQAQEPEGLRQVRQRWGRSFYSYRPASPHTDASTVAASDEDF